MKGFDVKPRGIIQVKGKGPMETYFVIGRQINKPLTFQRQPSHYSSPAAMVYAMAQTRRKVTGNTRKLMISSMLIKKYKRSILLSKNPLFVY